MQYFSSIANVLKFTAIVPLKQRQPQQAVSFGDECRAVLRGRLDAALPMQVGHGCCSEVEGGGTVAVQCPRRLSITVAPAVCASREGQQGPTLVAPAALLGEPKQINNSPW
jgi:hypothetical protein